MQYILLIHGSTATPPQPLEWDAFFERAKASGLFKGGSAIGAKMQIGAPVTSALSEHISGFMRFDSDDKESVLELLKLHPVILNGGTVELCELPKD